MDLNGRLAYPVFASVIPAKAGIQKMAAIARVCQNQDLWDYGIFRIPSPARIARNEIL